MDRRCYLFCTAMNLRRLNVSPASAFSEVLEAADRLSVDDQEALVAILHRRLALAGRRRITDDVKESRQEFSPGQCFPATPDELMREILR